VANLQNHNKQPFKVQINYDEDWDFFISLDTMFTPYNFNSNDIYDKCLISYIDLEKDVCYDEEKKEILSTDDYHYESAYTESGAVLTNIGYTGIDNGLISYKKDQITNQEFFDIFTNSKYNIDYLDYRLKLHQVTGNTMLYDYPTSYDKENGIKLNGGFYQGFYKTKTGQYQVLPSCMGSSWQMEFVLKPMNFEKESEKTLNDKYPENKGTFFYMGTRSENKWIYLYNNTLNEDIEEKDCDGETITVKKKEYIIHNFYDTSVKYNFNCLEDMEYNDYKLQDIIDFGKNEYEIKPMIRYFGEDDFNLVDTSTIDFTDYLKKINSQPSDYGFDHGEPFNLVDIDEEDGLINTKPTGSMLNNSIPGYFSFSENRDSDPNNNITGAALCSVGGCDPAYNNPNKNQSCQTITTCGCIRTVCDSSTLTNNTNRIYNCDTALEGILDGMFEEEGQYIANEINLGDFEYKTDNGFNIDTANQYYFYTDNKFLMFDRTKNGFNVGNWVEGTKMMYYGVRDKFNQNLFLLMNRTKTGYTVSNIDILRKEANQKYDINQDIYKNAFGLQIKDDGSVGYKYLVRDCDVISGDDKTTILSGFSKPNVIKNEEWNVINIKFNMIDNNTIKLYFYVNGKLVFISNELPMFDFRSLNEIPEKQEGVAYNISLGGGSQGLAETIMQNYYLLPDKVYPIEKNFAGTFIGYIRSFKFYNCPMELGNITNNYKVETIIHDNFIKTEQTTFKIK
jgi:hypothetical protein